VDPRELCKKPLEYFKYNVDEAVRNSDELAERKLKHYEKKRRTIIDMCTAKRRELIENEMKMRERDEAVLDKYLEEFKKQEHAKGRRVMKRELKQVLAESITKQKLQEDIRKGNDVFNSIQGAQRVHQEGAAARQNARAQQLEALHRSQDEAERAAYAAFKVNPHV